MIAISVPKGSFALRTRPKVPSPRKPVMEYLEFRVWPKVHSKCPLSPWREVVPLEEVLLLGIIMVKKGKLQENFLRLRGVGEVERWRDWRD